MIHFEYIETEKLNNIDQTKNWLSNIIIEEKKVEGELVYVFCNDNYLLEKNIQFLNHNTLTDVITFDYCNSQTINGDILISTERVAENAKLFQTDYLTELHRVMAHGLLHLLGYKDKEKEEKILMRKKEDYYINIL